MRRLRAVAAIVALAVIWLGYSVAREIAAGRAAQPTLQSQAPQEPGAAILPRGANAATQATLALADVPSSPRAAVSDTAELPSTSAPTEVPSVGAPASAAAPLIDPLPVTSEHEPFQSALHDAQAGVMPGSGRFRRGASGGGLPSMGGGGGGGTSASPAPAADETGSGSGVARMLGHRFSSETEESAGDAAPNSNSSTGGNSGSNSSSNGGNDGSNGSNSSNGSDGSNRATESNGSNPGGGDGLNTADGGELNSAGNTTGKTAGDGSPAPEGVTGGGQGIQSLASNVDGPNQNQEPRSIPEPGAILVGLGVAAVLARRRRR